MLADALLPWADRLVALDDLDAEDTVVVGSSGGADSSALLALVGARGFDVVATYVDHGVRPEAKHEAELVQELATRVGARARVATVDLGAGGNFEARARNARYAALERVREAEGATAVLVGHTADDQAETVLLNLLRGSATDGLAGMAPVRGTVRRPLLALRRHDTHEICARLGLAPVHDPMNDDPDHRRVWLRREVLPRLEAGAARDLVPVLARQAEVLRAEAEVLDELVAGVAAPGRALDVASVLALPLALQRRAVRRWLGPTPAGRADVDAVLGVAHGDARATLLVGGERVERAGGQLSRVTGGAGAPAPRPVVMALPGYGITAAGAIEAWVEEAAPVTWPSGRQTCVVDADRVGAAAVVRAARPDDRIQPLGTRGTKKVFDALAEAGVPASRRAASLVVASADDDTTGAVPAGSPWWVLGYRVDDRVRVTSRTRRFLWITATGRDG